MRAAVACACVAAGAALLLGPRCGPPPRSAPPAVPEQDTLAPTGPALSTAPAPSVAPPTAVTTVPVTPSQLAAVDRSQVAEPLTAALPHDEAHFSIDYRLALGALTLTIDLKAVLNRPEDRPRWRADLAAYKAEALAWLRAQGADPARLTVAWRPVEAAAL